MFNDIGKKIKIVAKVFCWIGIIISVIYVLGAFFDGKDVLRAFMILIWGVLGSWLATIVLYGFGELVDNVCQINRKIGDTGVGSLGTALHNVAEAMENSRQPSYDEWKCSCGRINPMYVGTCACGKSKDGSVSMVKRTSTGRTIKCPDCGSEESIEHVQCYKCGAKLR